MSVILATATRADAAELIRGNLDSREHHHPWTAPFTDEAGFNAWFRRTLCGPNVGLVAREAASGRVAGVINLTEIVAGAFQSAYLGYYGMAAMAGRGLMTEAVRLAASHAFGALRLHRLEANPARQSALDHPGKAATRPPGRGLAALPAHWRRVARPRALGLARR